MLIGAQLGVAAVAHYAVAMTLVGGARSSRGPGADPISPPIQSRRPRRARSPTVPSWRSAWAYAAICAPAIILTPTFFRYWVGADFALISSPVAEILFLGAWINGLAFILYSLLQGQGRPDVTGKIHAVEIVPFLAVLWFLTKAHGIEGAALAWTIRAFVDAAFLGWRLACPLDLPFELCRQFSTLAASIAIAHFVGANVFLAIGSASTIGLISAALALYKAPDLRHGIRLPLSIRRAVTPIS